MNHDPDRRATTEKVSELLKALTSPIRLKIIYLLSPQAELSSGVIQQQIAASQGLVSHHLIKMSDKGILTRTRRGKEVYYALADPVLRDWLELLLRIGQRTDA